MEDIVHLCCKGNNFNSFITEALILCIKVCIKLYIDICGDIYVQYIYIRTCIDHWIKKTIKHKHVIYVFSMMAHTYEGHVSRAGCSKLKPLRRDWKSKPRVPQSDRLENAWYMTNTDVRSACVCSDVLAVYIYCICVNIHTCTVYRGNFRNLRQTIFIHLSDLRIFLNQKAHHLMTLSGTSTLYW